jgi:glycosyltransferase involved in cell wall biosynthesis
VPVLHAVHRFGLPSETFIRDAILELNRVGWTQWVVTNAVEDERGAVPAARIVVPPATRPLVDRVGRRLTAGQGRDPVRETTAGYYLAALSRMPSGLLHAHFGWTAADCVLAARKLSLPFLVSFHGTDLTVLARDPAWMRYYAALLARADGVTVVSRFLEARLRGLGYEGRIDLIPSGVRLSAFPLREARRPGDAPSLLFVGRVVPGKGVDVLLAALRRVRDGGLSATLRVIGDGPLRADLEAAARSQGIADAVWFLGSRSHAEVRDELTRADIVVVPSQVMPGGLEEGSSVVSKEAQAIGVPVVATSVGGIPETLPPELRHDLVASGGDEALANGIVHSWDTREHWPERIRLQRDWIAAEFAWENVARKLSGVYERVLTQRPPVNARLARALRRRPGRKRRSR